jgi:hypothetical protein
VTIRHLITILLTAVACVSSGSGQPITFADVSSASGVNVSHIGTPENRYIIESMSGGVAVFDCDGDGFLDIATVNGSSVERFKSGGDPFVTIYRQIDGANTRTPRFDNVTSVAGTSRKGWGMGVTAVDYDGDRISDLFVTGFAGNVLYRGLGNCKFVDMTEKAGIKGSGFMTGSAWADFDRDGDLDVFVPGYVELDLNKLPVFGSSATCSFRGIRVQCGPRGLPGDPDLFFRNKGGGLFEEVGTAVGLGDKKEFFGLGAIWTDFDNDGWPDLYVANDSGPNYLYKNRSGVSFADISFESGTSYNRDGNEQGSMGVASGDFDNDGLLDLFVTNFDTEYNTLYKNLGPKGFLDVSTESMVAAPSKPFVGWGTGFFDFDNDGLLDMLVANGHVYPQMELVQGPGQLGFRQHFLLHRNLGNGKFAEVAKEAGLESVPLRSRRGIAFGDLNNDGLIDAVVTSLGDLPSILMNTSRNSNRRLTVRLVQDPPNTESIGARLTLKTTGRSLIREVEAGGSYLSQNDLRLHFGLGADENITAAEVRWSDGSTEKITGLEFDKIITIAKKKGIVRVENYRSP